MSGAASTQQARRSRPVRILRRLLRVLLWTLAVVALLLVVAWLFRKQLVEPWLKPRLEAVLASALGAQRVAIGGLDGDWLTSIDVRDVTIEGGAPPLREVRGARVQAAYSLAALLRGDLSGLRTATVTAPSAVVDLRPTAAAAASPEAPSAPFDLAPYESLLALGGDGVTVHVDQLQLLAPAGERTGALDVGLPASAGARTFTVSYAGVRVDGRVARADGAADGDRAQATVAVADPGAVLDLFGLGAGVREGSLHAELGGSLTPPRVTARIDLADLVHDGRRLASSHIVAWFDGERLAVDSATIDLPGVRAELHELTMPSPFASGAPALDELAGRFAVQIDDLAPHAALLPEQLQALLPIAGQLAGSFAAGVLRLDASQLRARGVDLQLRQGTFPLAGGDWRRKQGSLQFALALHEFAPELPSIAPLRATGRIDGTLAGSLDAPGLDVQLDLGACELPEVAFAGARGHLRADSTAIAVAGLQLQGLAVAALGERSPTSVVLDASCRLRDGELVADSLQANVDLGGVVPPELWTALGDAVAPAGTPSPWTLHVDARHGADGITITGLRARTADGAPLAIAIDGAGTVPLRWSGATALEVLEAGELELRMTASQAATAADGAQIAFDGTLRLGARKADLRLGAVEAGALQLQGSVAAGFGLAHLLDPDLDLARVPLQVALDVTDVDLARLPAAWTGGVQFGGHVVGKVNAAGPVGVLAPEVELRLTDGELRGPGMPTLRQLQVGLEVRSRELADATTVQLRVTGELDAEPGLDPHVDCRLDLRCDEQGTRLGPAVLQLGGGELQLQLASNLRRAELLALTIDPATTTLTGTIGLHEFALDRLPPALLGLGSLRGSATGEVVIDGSLAAGLGPQLVQSARLSLRDGELKASNLPRIEQLACELDYAPKRLQLVSATGTLGAGAFTASGTLQHDDLLRHLDDAELQLQLDGHDLLLFRGDGAKVRASVRLLATGTMRDARVGGEIVLGRGSKYVRRISILPDLGSRGGESANEGLQLVELPPALGDRLTFDVGITTDEPFEVRTNVFDGEVDVAAALRGKGSAPRIEGTMSLRSGMLRFPGANLRVTSGRLTFTRSEPLYPDLTVQAEGKRMGFLVTMSISGRYDQPLVQLSSVPPLPPQDLIVLVTTGQLPSTLVAGGAAGQARFVGGYLAKEVLETWFGSESTERGGSLLDRLTIESGREVSQNGTESVLVEYELTPKVSVQVERDAYEDYNLGLVLRFRFR